MSRIIGSFYLKKTESGNLQGEFTNNMLFTVNTESADLREEGEAPFLGKYFSTWYEGDVPCSAELVVTYLPNAENKNVKYRLLWTNLNGVPIYEGEAILAEGMLIGHFISLP
jgi:hypothetical protein